MEFKVLIVFALITFSTNFEYIHASKCNGVICENGGTVATDGTSCWCSCLPVFIGTRCETKRVPSHWPNREYALPMSVYGCPEDSSRDWQVGYLNMTFIVPLGQFNYSKFIRRISDHDSSEANNNRTVHDSDSVFATNVNQKYANMLGYVDDFTLQMSFCYRNSTYPYDFDQFPYGDFSVFGHERGCPSSLRASFRTILLPQILFWNKGGRLPYLNLTFMDDHTRLEMLLCVKENSSTFFEELQRSYIVIKNDRSDCPNVTNEVSYRHPLIDEFGREFSFCVKVSIVKDSRRNFYNSVYDPWDDNGYALPKSVYECPEDSSGDWGAGYLNMTFVVPLGQFNYSQFIRKNSDRDSWRANNNRTVLDSNYSFAAKVTQYYANMLDYVDDFNLQMSFCYRNSYEKLHFFPYGHFSVFGLKRGCPKSLRPSFRTIILPKIVFSNKGGSLPYLNLTVMDDHTRLEMLFCVKENSNTFFEELQRPYIVIKNDNSDCSKDAHEVSYRHPLIDEYGRELSFCAKVANDDSHWNLRRSVNIVRTVIENSQKCNLTLGMNDMHVQDYQITSSSSLINAPPKMARPQSTGWCSGTGDLRPYVQVDLLLMTIVEGIIVTSWVEALGCDANICSLDGSNIATNNFNIAFSMSKEFTNPYFEQKMAIDIRRRFNEIHTFWFVDRLYTRYVRLYPHRQSLNHKVCMKFELVGCRINGTHSLICTNSTTKEIYESDSGYVPSAKKPSEWYNYTLDQCKDMCLDVKYSICSAIEYSTAASTCRVYGTTSFQFDRVERSDSFDYFGVANCMADPFEFSTVLEVNAQLPGAQITSIGYPFEYTPTIFRFSNAGNPTLLYKIIFTHISLKASQSPGCTDTISSFWLDITSKHNGLRPTFFVSYEFELDMSFDTLVFKTCPRHPSEKITAASGFKAYILPFDGIHVCFYICQAETSSLLQSPSLRGYPNEDNHQSSWIIWDIFYQYKQLLVLVFDIVNINCKSGSKLTIDHDLGTDEFCNENRPAVRKTYYTGSMEITFSTGLILQNVFVEGVQLKYNRERLQGLDNYFWLPGFDNYLAHVSLRTDYGDKSYYFFHQQEPISWTQALDTCINIPGGTLANIKSQEENKAVRDGLYHSWSHKIWAFKYTHAHIGLSNGRQCRTYQGSVRCDLWTDGTPVSYTAWQKYYPRPGKSSNCTAMDFTKQTQNSWIQVHCRTVDSHIAVQSFACETTKPANFNSSLRENRLTAMDGHVLDQENYSHLYRCSSGEYVSPAAVCNSLAECHNSSDENGCKNTQDQQCDLNMFTCDGGKCIHISALCDFVNDCEDRTDEYCFQSVDHKKGRFYCKSMEDIDSSKRCDGVFDCKDKSDESNCDECNSETSILCDRNKCLPLRFVCDYVYDCIDQSDEGSCDNMAYRTCDDVYRIGINTTGYYETAEGYELLCVFDNVTSTITMTFVNVDWWVIRMDEEYGMNSLDFIQHAQKAKFVCFQNFTPEINQVDAQIASLDNLTFDTFDEALMKIEQGTNLTSYKLEHSHIRVSVVGDRTPSLRLNIHSPFDFTRYRIPVGPVICKKDMLHNESIIACGDNLKPVSRSYKCLYKRDVSGKIVGCRNMAHLQNCDDFVCPSGYMKCPNSYCIPASYVCNMQLECPFGDDEADCWCTDKEGLLFAIHNHENLEDVLLLVRMFVGVNRTVYLIELDDEKYSLIQVTHLSVYRNWPFIGTHENDVGNFSMTNTTQNTHIDIVMINLKIDETLLVVKTIIQNIKQQIPDSSVNIFKVHIDTFSLAEAPIVPSNVSNITISDTPVQEVNVTTVGQMLMNAHTLLGDTCLRENVCDGYVCKFTTICLPLDHLCDDITNCPNGDDEMMCNFRCPDTCSCDGLVVDCRRASITWEDISNFPAAMRSLDVSGNKALSGSYLNLTKTFPFLYRLNVSKVGIKGLVRKSFTQLPLVQIIDLRANELTSLENGTFSTLRHLKRLNLEHNKGLQKIEPGAFKGLTVKQLSLHGCGVKVIEKDTFDGLDLNLLNLSMSTIDEIHDGAFRGLRTDILDLTVNKIQIFGKDMFKDIANIGKLMTSHYRLCCIKPFSLTDDNCFSPKDEFSTCADLIANPALQSCLWLLGIFAFVGNCSSIIFRAIFDRARLKIGYGIFVTNLAISDLLMSIYMFIIAVADTMFRNKYIVFDVYWRTSFWCKLCGVLSTVSSEASVLFICLITIDRIIATKFPFSGFKFALKNSAVISVVCWVISISVAVYPIVNASYFGGEFYSSRAVCVALPLTRDRPPGWLYSFIIFIGFNCVAFIMIALGQAVIYSEVKRSARRQKMMNVYRSNDLSIARSLFLVVLTDFMCWFPIGCMGFMALAGYPIPGEVYAWTVVLVMPINSAINPFLYTYSILISKTLAKQKKEAIVADTPDTTIRRHTEIAQSFNTHTVSRFRKLGCTTLDDIMATRCLTITEITLIVSEVTKYINQVHEAEAVTTTIDPKNILVNQVNNKITRNIHVVDSPRPTLTPTDQANDMSKIGSLASRMLKARMRQY